MQLRMWGGGTLSPQQIQGRALVGAQETKHHKALEILQLTLAKPVRGPFTLTYNFVNIVIKSSSEAAVTNIIASIRVTLDKKNLVCQLAR